MAPRTAPLQNMRDKFGAWQKRRASLKEERAQAADEAARFKGSWRVKAKNQDVTGQEKPEKPNDPSAHWSRTEPDMDPDASLTTLGGHKKEVYALAFAPNAERMASGGNWSGTVGGKPYGELKFWHFRDEELSSKRKGERQAINDDGYGPVCESLVHPGQVLDVDYAANGRHVVTGCSDTNAYLYDTKKGKNGFVAKLQGHHRKVYGAKFTPVGSSCPGEIVATASMDTSIRLWDVETAATLSLLHATAPLYGMQFDVTGTRIAAVGDSKTVFLFDWRVGAPTGRLDGHTDALWGAAFAKDDYGLVTGGLADELFAWDMRTMRTRWRGKNAHGGTAVHRCIFSPDGAHVISAGRDNKVRVWDAEAGHHLDVLSGHQAAVFNLCFHPAGDRLLSSSVDSTIKVWQFPRDGMVMSS